MVSTNTLQRVSTHLLMPTVAIYLLLVSLDVTQASVEYSVEKPTLLGRTPPIIPGERFFFKRESKDGDGEDDTPSTTQPPVESRSGLKEEDEKESESNDNDTSKKGNENDKGADQDSEKSETGDDKKEVDETDKKEDEEEKASEGSRHLGLGLSFFGGFKKRKTTKRPREVQPPPVPTPPVQPSQPKVTSEKPSTLESTSVKPSQPGPATKKPASKPKSTTKRPTPKPKTTTKKPSPKPKSTTKKPGPQTSTPSPPSTASPIPEATVKPNPTPPAPSVQPTSTQAPQIETTRSPQPANVTTTVPPVGPVTTRAPQPGNVTTIVPSIEPMTTPIPTTTTASPSNSSTNPQVNGTTTLGPIVVNVPFRVPPTNSTSGNKQTGAVKSSTQSPKANGNVTSSEATTKLPNLQHKWPGITLRPQTTKQPKLGPVTITSEPPIVVDRAGAFNGSSTPRPGRPYLRPEFYTSSSTTTTNAPTTTSKPTSVAPTTNGSTSKHTSPTSKPGGKTSTTTGPAPSGSTTQVPRSTGKPTTKNPILTTITLSTSSSSVAPSAKPTRSTTAKPSPEGKTPSPLPTGPPVTTNKPSISSTEASQMGKFPPPVDSTTPAPGMNGSITTTTGPPTIIAHVASMNAQAPKYTIVNGTAYIVEPNPIPIVVNPNITRQMVNSDAELLLEFNRTIFDPRDVTYFLESHPAHSVHDPRVYFTSERTTRSLVIMSRELARIPEKLRFAYMVRVFNELGRKIASKLNYYSVELAAILKKGPDDLGNKPEVSQLVDAVNNAFESKDDGEIQGQAEIDLEYDNYMSTIIDKNPEKKQLFRAAMTEISSRFAQLISYFVLKATTSSGGDSKPVITIPEGGRKRLPVLLGESLKSGAKAFVLETVYDDRFRIPLDAVGYTNMILNDTISMMTKRIEDKDMNVSESIKRDFADPLSGNLFKDLNLISDKIGLIGSWNSFLFSNLGSAERLMKVFASLLSRVPPEAKSRWINMYIAQIHTELERTIAGFVTMQGMPFHGNQSEQFLLDPERTIEILPNKVPTIRDNYLADKNRIPARCYLAGRRWRLVLSRGLDKFIDQDLVIDAMANRVGSIKNRMMAENGNEIHRLCLPRLEVGIRGWTIDGHPPGDSIGDVGDKFPLKNPIEGLTEMRDPFASGVTLGFGIGVRVGYNEERNATLEIEQSSHLGTGLNEFDRSLNLNEVKYVAMVSYRRAATVGGRKALEIAVREGYLSALKVSVRAGMNIPVETGSMISALKSVSFAGLAGQEAGKSAAEAFITGKDHLSQETKKSLVKVGQSYGLLAGEIAGEFIGSIVGKAAAEEAYRRSIIRGGKVARAKFHLEEYEAGAKLGFDYGVKEGKRIASSSTLDPSAPSLLRLPKPVFSGQEEQDNAVDHWEKELIPPLTDSIIADLASVRDHTPVRGSLRGTYKVAKEVKKGLKRVSYTNVTYDLDVFAEGFIKNSIAYLTLNGTVNKMGILRGSLIARDIFNEDQQ